MLLSCFQLWQPHAMDASDSWCRWLFFGSNEWIYFRINDERSIFEALPASIPMLSVDSSSFAITMKTWAAWTCIHWNSISFLLVFQWNQVQAAFKFIAQAFAAVHRYALATDQKTVAKGPAKRLLQSDYGPIPHGMESLCSQGLWQNNGSTFAFAVWSLSQCQMHALRFCRQRTTWSLIGGAYTA